MNSKEETERYIPYDLYETFNINKHLSSEGPFEWKRELIYDKDIYCGSFKFLGESYRILIETIHFEDKKGINFSIEVFNTHLNKWTTKMPHLKNNKEASKVIGVMASEMYTLFKTEYKDVVFNFFVGPYTDKRVYSWFIKDFYRTAQFGYKSVCFTIQTGNDIVIVSNGELHHHNNEKFYEFLNKNIIHER